VVGSPGGIPAQNGARLTGRYNPTSGRPSFGRGPGQRFKDPGRSRKDDAPPEAARLQPAKERATEQGRAAGQRRPDVRRARTRREDRRRTWGAAPPRFLKEAIKEGEVLPQMSTGRGIRGPRLVGPGPSPSKPARGKDALINNERPDVEKLERAGWPRNPRGMLVFRDEAGRAAQEPRRARHQREEKKNQDVLLRGPWNGGPHPTSMNRIGAEAPSGIDALLAFSILGGGSRARASAGRVLPSERRRRRRNGGMTVLLSRVPVGFPWVYHTPGRKNWRTVRTRFPKQGGAKKRDVPESFEALRSSRPAEAFEPWDRSGHSAPGPSLTLRFQRARPRGLGSVQRVGWRRPRGESFRRPTEGGGEAG